MLFFRVILEYRRLFKMYQVVLFLVSNEVECVPVAWLKSEMQVYWPDGISLSVQQ